MIEKICRLCFESKTTTINIFTGKGVKLEIASVIRTHFPHEFSDSESFPKWVCTECWKKLSDFHAFYEAVEVAKQNYLQKLIPNLIDDDNPVNSVKFEPFNEEVIIVESLSAAVVKIENLDEVYESQHEASDAKDFFDASDSSDNDDGLKGVNDELRIDCNLSGDEPASPRMPSTKPIDTSVPKNKSEKDEFDKLAPSFMHMECEVCKQPFTKLSEVRKHYRVKHKQRNVWMKCCQKRMDLYDIIEHIRHHLDPEIFRCLECGKTFLWNRDLKRHRTSHQPKQFQCDICKKKVTALHILKEHILKLHTSVERQYECHICHTRHAFQHILQNHILRKHTKNLQQNECEICKKRFISKNALRIHIRSIHERHYRQVCHICAGVYNSKNSLLMHLKNHSDVEEPRVNCKICGRSYKNLRGLNSHIATHNEAKTIFQCPHCPKISPNRNALSKHVGSIHNFKIHKCHLCEKEFKRALVLKEHLASHSGEYLYSCQYCPKKFKYRNKMYTHYKKCHPLEWNVDRSRDTSKIYNESDDK